jgi:hypothetical protein
MVAMVVMVFMFCGKARLRDGAFRAEGSLQILILRDAL